MKYLNKFETNESYDSVKKVAHKSYVSLVTDSDTVVYDKNLNEGVFIQHIDGTLYTTDEWTAGGFVADDANGVAVVDNKCSFVVSTANLNRTAPWANYTSDIVEGVFTAYSFAQAITDYNGIENTANIVKIDNTSAAYYCDNYTFPNGAKGYLGSAGEWNILIKNFNYVQTALSKVGEQFDTRAGCIYWTSTQSPSHAFVISTCSLTPSAQTKSTSNNVRPFTTLWH